MWPRSLWLSWFFFSVLLGGGLKSNAQTFDHIKDKVKVHTLGNGMKWIVLERNDAPVASFHIYADVGSVNESYGITGISHLLEHLAFSGTKVVGTTDYSKESALLDSQDALFDQIQEEKARINPDPVKLKELQEAFHQKGQEAQQFEVAREFVALSVREGDRAAGASTWADSTQYSSSLPSNRVEFWMALNSDRFLNPVFRGLHRERESVLNERWIRIESSPGSILDGRLREDLAAMAFKAHPYHHDVIGHRSDLEMITRRDVENYFRKYYAPSNLTAAIVGDVNPDEVFRLAELYFGRIPSSPKPEAVRTREPEQWGERRFQVSAKAEPLLVVGYHRPGINHKDRFVFEAVSTILGNGQSSRLYQAMVKEKKVAVDIGSFNGWPGEKFPHLSVFYAVPARGQSSEECLRVLSEEIEKVKSQPVTEAELATFKNTTRKRLIDSMKTNAQLAALLTRAEVLLGGWQRMFDELQEVEAVSPADIQRIARTYLERKNRTIGEIVRAEDQQ